MKLQACALLLLTLTTGCFSTHSSHVSSTRHELLEREGDSPNERVTYTLAGRSNASPRITRTTQTSHKVAKIGLRGADVDGELKDIRFLQPWHGILVNSVSRGGAAELAGIAKGDILLKFDETELSNLAQLRGLLELSDFAGAEISITLARRNGPNSYHEVPITLALTLGTVQETKTTSHTWDLLSDERVFDLTGLQVGSLPDDLAQEIYGSSEPVVLIAEVMTGSPAYLAGFRIGDRVLKCDDKPVVSHMDISRAILSRANQVLDPETPYQVPERGEASGNTSPVSLTVEGPQGHHKAELPVTGDLVGRSRLVIPILFNQHSTVSRTRWSFLDFIFQFGANYRSRYLSTDSRAPASSTLFSLFPLGMFEYESSEDSYELTLFWFIKIGGHE